MCVLGRTVNKPFELVAASSPPRTATKRELLQRVRDLERQALGRPAPPAAAACLQDARFLTERTRAVYAELAARGAQVHLFARSLQAWVAPGVRGIDLDDDALVDQWTLVLTGPQPVCFAAQDLNDAGERDDDRAFVWALTCDPAVVEQVASLLGLVCAAGDDGNSHVGGE